VLENLGVEAEAVVEKNLILVVGREKSKQKCALDIIEKSGAFRSSFTLQSLNVIKWRPAQSCGPCPRTPQISKTIGKRN